MNNYYKLITKKFLKQVNKHSEKPALITNKETYTYKELACLIDELSLEINNKSKYGSIICINTDRNVRLVAAMLASIRCSRSFFTIDQSLPLNRIDMLIDQIDPGIYINNENIDINTKRSYRTDYKDIAYCIFTSGSTGKPKGVCISCKSLYYSIDSISNAVEVSSQDRMLAGTSILFDPFIFETVICLCRGITVILADQDESSNIRKMLSLIEEYKATILQCVPSKLKCFIKYDKDFRQLKSINKYLIGGEPPVESDVNLIKSKTNAAIYNLYGLTEDTIWTSASNISITDQYDIGKALKHHKIHVLNRDMRKARINEHGEIYISGKGIYSGFIDSEEESEDICIIKKKKYIRTRDLAYRSKDNKIFWVGRKGNQIKINGYRISPEEIEKIAKNNNRIENAIVKLEVNKDGKKVLTLYYESHDAEPVDISELKSFLSLYLPEYMIPAKYYPVECFNYLPSGKTSRNN